MGILGGIKAGARQLAYAANNWGRFGAYVGSNALKGNYGNTVFGATAGAIGGGVTGGLSEEGSILGGAAKGAIGGAALGRYGMNPLNSLRRMGAFSGVAASMNPGAFVRSTSLAYSKAVKNQFMRDARSTKIAANRGFNRIKGLFQ